jgi:hypothetical protein
VYRWNCILFRALTDHKTAIAEVEFSNGVVARVELGNCHCPEELAVGGHGKMGVVGWSKMQIEVVPEGDGERVVHVKRHCAVRVNQGHMYHYSETSF